MNKKGYHSTQPKAFGTIPKSEFYGFVLGYATGMIIKGLFRLETQYILIVLALIGLGIGVWVDRKYFMVKDEPSEDQDPDADGREDVAPEEGGAS